MVEDENVPHEDPDCNQKILENQLNSINYTVRCLTGENITPEEHAYFMQNGTLMPNTLPTKFDKKRG